MGSRAAQGGTAPYLKGLSARDVSILCDVHLFRLYHISVTMISLRLRGFLNSAVRRAAAAQTRGRPSPSR